jgi:hypothetical protein
MLMFSPSGTANNYCKLLRETPTSWDREVGVSLAVVYNFPDSAYSGEVKGWEGLLALNRRILSLIK